MDNLEIERKFFVSPNIPKLMELLSGRSPNIEERFYLYRQNGTELRITKVSKPNGSIIYQLDRMQLQLKAPQDSHVVRTKDRLAISHQEFESLLSLIKKLNPYVQPIVRWSYQVQDKPKIEIKVYKDRFDGLIRAEVEFESIEESNKYQKPDWFGQEITDLPIGRDTNLPDLSNKEFMSILKSLRS